jgi:hypothetical protein
VIPSLPPPFPLSLPLSLFLFPPFSLSLSLSLCLPSHPLSIFSGALLSNALRRARIFSRLARSCIERVRLATVSLNSCPSASCREREKGKGERAQARESESERGASERDGRHAQAGQHAISGAGGAACNLRSSSSSSSSSGALFFICSLLF